MDFGAFRLFRSSLPRARTRTSARTRVTVGALGAALALAAVSTAGDAQAYAVKKTTHGELVHWDSDVVEYTLDPSIDANVPHSSAATVHAMEAWSGSVGAPTLRERALSATSPKQPAFDSQNGVFFMPNGYAPAGRALAITVLTYDNATGRILDADVIVNGAYKFAILADGAVPKNQGTTPSTTDSVTHTGEVAEDATAVYDVPHVLAHELGHTLGMNDELQRKEALMYRYSTANMATRRAPATDDIAGLAELYSPKLEATGNGCGSATVAPKKPSVAASQLALVATLGFLFFLILRGRSDRRARFALVAVAAVAAVVMLPRLPKTGSGVARASELAPGHARAKVLATTTTMEDGLFRTTYKLATTACRTASCPKMGHGFAWGGASGNIRQEVGGHFAPNAGDDVDVSFAKLPNALAPLSAPLGAPVGSLTASGDETVRVLTLAD